jgi:hypothetical protein
MATKLKNVKLREISLVDKGANPDAHIMLAKRDDASPAPADSLLKRQMDEIAALDAAYASTVAKADDAAVYAAYRTKRHEILERYEQESIAAKMALIGYRPS